MPPFRCVLLGEQALLVECGERLLAAGHTIAAVVTDTPRLREWAVQRSLRVERTPEALLAAPPADVDWLFAITWLKPLADEVLALGRRGALNFHDGPLPQCAGLNTPMWALLNGETRHGIRWHRMTTEIDGGRVLVARDFAIDADETAFSLNAKCFEAGLAGFDALLDRLATGDEAGEPQPPGERRVHFGADRPMREALLDPMRPAVELARIVRALDNGAYWQALLKPRLRFAETDVLVAAAEPVEMLPTETTLPPATLIGVDADGLRLRCSDGVLHLGGLARLDGTRLSADEALALAGGAGVRLPAWAPPGDDEAKALRRAARHEAGARAARQRARPTAVPSTTVVPAEGFTDPQALARALLAVGRGADGRHLAVGLRFANASEPSRWVDPVLPLVVELPDGTANDDGVALDVLASRLVAAIDAARRAGGLPSDLRARDPRLAGTAAPADWPVQLQLDEQTGAWPAQGSASLAIQRPAAARALQFGLFFWNVAEEHDLGRSDKYRLLLESARFADTHGFNAVWTPERHFQAFGGLFPNPAVTSAALATITSKVALRAGSCVVPLHHPIRIAEEWAVVDNLSNGRVGISIAAGWATPDFALRPENHAEAKRVMFEAAEQVRRLWRGETLEFPGPQGPVKVRTLPRPLQAELPIWVTTAGNPETFAEAGRMGAHLLTHLLGQSVEELATKIAAYRKAWREAGHAGEGIVSLMLHTLVGDNREAVEAVVRGPMKAYLKTAMALVKAAAWQFPTFKRMSAEQGQNLDAFFQSASPEDMDELLEFAFQRYFRDSGLFGSESDAVAMARRVAGIDVDEIACLIDFGLEADTVLAHLPALDRVRAAFAMSRTASANASTGGRSASAPKPATPAAAQPVPSTPAPTPAPQRPATTPSIDTSAIETTLRAHWIALLGIDDFGRDDNFFDLGGHSLLVVQLLRLLREGFSESIRVTDLFRHVTLAAQTRFVASLVAPAAPPQAPAAAPAEAVDTPATAGGEAPIALDRGRARAEARRALAALRGE
ncbi:MupA/Atu3671 family FMN-dependent luciferase-like monooxygenase [Silanimonas sp.]|uniref:MupA/Atu3671 family FMN-dependent luciferase-like monooxygenase n=1 Tax=Silanimonas sp. TaxID=1929290 RepID=UPI0037C4FD99